ncbi:MAG: DUF86 domain-containing protein [Bdellovibrionaceae bacterium]|nr:DUF86 domain-containing protein [Bdellovibrionales bacterium]MCB9084978.1 DUF86 domain-containing protein [Pseudobdellovibrionaceae bacterium]
MSKKYQGSDLYLTEMINACVKIQEYAANTSKEDFLKQRESFDAICMQLSHLGEQVTNLESSPDRIIQHFPEDLEWPALKGLRNRIGHAYMTIDAQMIWDFVTQKTQELESSLRRILKKRYGQ